MLEKIKNDQLEDILDLISGKSVFKQNLYTDLTNAFDLLKKETKEIIKTLKKRLNKKNSSVIKIEFVDKSDLEFQIYVGGDALLFVKHTNVFCLQPSHSALKSEYFQSNPNFKYFGMINIYNFLSDSFRYNRINDTGVLITRILLNEEKKMLLQGSGVNKKEFADIEKNVFDIKKIQALVYSTILTSMNLDLYLPRIEDVELVELSDILSLSKEYKIKTSKKLGFNYKK